MNERIREKVRAAMAYTEDGDLESAVTRLAEALLIICEENDRRN